MARKVNELHWLVNHELTLAKRYRRFVSLMLLESDDDLGNLKSSFLAGFRDSDVCFEVSESCIAVLMSETDQTGAKNAYDRLKQELFFKEKNLRYSLATYPEDNLDPLGFMRTVYQRLRETRVKNSMAVKSQYLMRAVDEALNETIEKSEG